MLLALEKSRLMAPCPWHRLMPTGGVEATEARISAWITAGAAAVGMERKLLTAQVVKDKDYDWIAEKITDSIGWIRKAREK